MQKKESYKHILPHFQQPGQAYFVTWCLKEAIPAKMVQRYSKRLELLKYQIDFHSDWDRKFPTSVKERLQSTDHIKDLKNEYYSVRQRYFKAFDEFLGVQQFPKINLIKKENL